VAGHEVFSMNRFLNNMTAACVAYVCVAGVCAAQNQSAADDARIKYERFKAVVKSETVVIVDVRDADSYRAGHIPGAVSVPLAGIASYADTLIKRNEKREIVIYCS